MTANKVTYTTYTTSSIVMDYTVQTVNEETLFVNTKAIDHDGKLIKGKFDPAKLDDRLTGQLIDGTLVSINGNLPNDAKRILDTTITNVSNSYATKVTSVAFGYCSRLKTVSLQNATSIASEAFMRTGNADSRSPGNSLERVYFPKVEYIGSKAFSGCSVLQSAQFQMAEYIGNAAFDHCVSLKRAAFAEATHIGSSAFFEILELETVYFPKAAYIGDHAFYGCNELNSANFPHATHIGSTAFMACLDLSTASFNRLTYIGRGAFYECVNLEKVYLLGSTVPEMNTSDTFPVVTCFGATYDVYPSGNWTVIGSQWSFISNGEYLSDTDSRVIIDPPFDDPGTIWDARTRAAYLGQNSWMVLPEGTRGWDSQFFLTVDGIRVGGDFPLGLKERVTSQIWNLTIYVPNGLKNNYLNHSKWGQYASRIVGV